MKFSAKTQTGICCRGARSGSRCSNFAQAEIPSWCGPKQATLGSARWLRRQQLAPGYDRLRQGGGRKCPSITKYEYADGQGDTQKAISDIKGMAAKGIDALVVFPDAGPAMLPAITSVYKAGKVIVPYRVEVGGKAGENYNKFIGTDFKNDGVNWGNWIKSVLPMAATFCS